MSDTVRVNPREISNLNHRQPVICMHVCRDTDERLYLEEKVEELVYMCCLSFGGLVKSFYLLKLSGVSLSIKWAVLFKQILLAS